MKLKKKREAAPGKKAARAKIALAAVAVMALAMILLPLTRRRHRSGADDTVKVMDAALDSLADALGIGDCRATYIGTAALTTLPAENTARLELEELETRLAMTQSLSLPDAQATAERLRKDIDSLRAEADAFDAQQQGTSVISRRVHLETPDGLRYSFIEVLDDEGRCHATYFYKHREAEELGERLQEMLKDKEEDAE